MAEYTTISIRIPKEKKKLLEKYRINIEKVIQKALDQEIQARKKKILFEKMQRASEILTKIPRDTFNSIIREDRDQR